MVFIAYPQRDHKTWEFIVGDFYKNMSIATDRYYYLYELNLKDTIKISLRDPETEKWTKHVEFPGLLWESEPDGYGGTKYSRLTAAVDVHRSVLSNEIIIESDYPTYGENYEATKVVGKIIEEKGFTPLYYYSGNKSIHIHIFFDWNCLKELDLSIQDQLRIIFQNSKLKFKKKFIEWLRAKMISCWDTNAKKFDTDLIRATHLIRCELSKNKKGYKTFLGYSHKDLSFVPYICNESNRIYPKLGEIRLSHPNNVSILVEEFIDDLQKKEKKQKIIRKNNSLNQWIQGNNKETLRECVRAILSEDFKKVGDGYQRAMFILLNELKKVYGEGESRVIINDWNSRMEFPIKGPEIEYRLKLKSYSLSCDYIHKFLKEIGIDVSRKCKGKLYK